MTLDNWWSFIGTLYIFLHTIICVHFRGFCKGVTCIQHYWKAQRFFCLLSPLPLLSPRKTVLTLMPLWQLHSLSGSQLFIKRDSNFFISKLMMMSTSTWCIQHTWIICVRIHHMVSLISKFSLEVCGRKNIKIHYTLMSYGIILSMSMCEFVFKYQIIKNDFIFISKKNFF